MGRIEKDINGVCCKKIVLEFNDESKKITDVQFIGGCPGNLSAIAMLVKNKTCTECANLFDGHKCGSRATSCMDQFAQLLKEVH